MPLARIITRTPQDAVGVSDYLLSQGYTVETISPTEFRVTPAELELNLGKCRPSEALARAQALVELGRGAPPAETGPPPPPTPALKAKIPVAYDITGQPVEFADEGEAELRQDANSMSRTLASMLRRARTQLVVRLEEAGNWARTPVRNSLRRRAERRALRLEAELAREQEQIRREEELARERMRQEMERQREEAELAERRRQEQIAAAQQTGERARLTARSRPLPGRARIATPRKAAVTTFAATLVLLLGFVAYTNRRPASPLSPGALMQNDLVKQDLPFGAATITPQPAMTQKPSPGTQGKPSPSRRSADQTPRAKPQPSTAKLKRPSEME